jgi:hypothetical protein
MGENAQKIGKKLESVGFDLLSMFNWKKKMGDKEIKCLRSTHKNVNGTSKRTHGVDLYMEYQDPYLGEIQGVFIECKNRGWTGISKANIQNWVNEEINLIDCARNNPELQEFYADGADKNCALVIINCNDGEYDHDKFEQYLATLEIPNKKNGYKIFIAGNKTLEKWDAIDSIIKSDYSDNINVLYPSINNSQPISEKYWSLNHLFAKYVFCETEEKEERRGGDILVNKILVVFCFDCICAESIQYLWSMCRTFQYENRYDGYHFCFWVDSSKDCDYINENFINIIKNYNNGRVDDKIIKSIKTKFLLNRKINMVDNR